MSGRTGGTTGRDRARRAPVDAAGSRRGLLVVAGVAAGVLLTAGTVVALVAVAPSAPPPPPVPVAEVPEEVGLECRRGGDAALAAERAGELEAGTLVRTADVLACPAAHDGRTVTLVGEVVGDVVRRAGGAWLTVNDDAYALVHGPLVGHGTRAGRNAGIAVWAPDGTHEGLGVPGRAGRRGAVVRVTGTIHRTDPADGGGLTLRAETLEVLATAVTVRAPINVPQAVVAAVALAVVGAAGAVRLRAVGTAALRRRVDRLGGPRRGEGLSAGR